MHAKDIALRPLGCNILYEVGFQILSVLLKLILVITVMLKNQCLQYILLHVDLQGEAEPINSHISILT